MLLRSLVSNATYARNTEVRATVPKHFSFCAFDAMDQWLLIPLHRSCQKLSLPLAFNSHSSICTCARMPAPSRTHQMNREDGCLLAHIRRKTHLLHPRQARLPASGVC
jgi:hypothetical protein